jgi:hypothetical protein
MVGSPYQNYVEDCPLSEVQLIYMTLQGVTLLPSSGDWLSLNLKDVLIVI